MFIIGVLVGSMIVFIYKNLAAKPRRISDNKWISLPSGWSKNISEDCQAFAMNVDSKTSYWWISRKGRTLIEGPTNCIEAAMLEVDYAQKEFLRQK